MQDYYLLGSIYEGSGGNTGKWGNNVNSMIGNNLINTDESDSELSYAPVIDDRVSEKEDHISQVMEVQIKRIVAIYQ